MNRALIPLTLLASASISAQVYYSTVVGTIRDPTSAVVPGVRVVATEVRTGITSTTATDANGDYRIATLQPGVYEISAAKDGFQSQTLSGIQLYVGQTSRVDINLEVGNVVQ